MSESTNQSCANCGGLLALTRDGDTTTKHFDGSYYCVANRTHAELTEPNDDDSAIIYSTKPGCPTCHSPQPHLHPAVQFEGEVSICKDPFHSQVTPQNPKVDSEMPTGLIWSEHERAGGTHIEWHVPCGCAYHPSPFPHVHPCSDEHKRPDLHASAQEQAIVTAAREWAVAWGKVWDSDEPATTEAIGGSQQENANRAWAEAVNEVNDKSKALHDKVLDLEREIILRRRRAIMPGYDKKLEDWLS